MSGQGAMFDALTCDPVDLLERGGDVLADKSRWPQRLVELYDVLFAYARKAGFDDEATARDASARAVLIADDLGGSVVYLPRGDALRKAVRDSEAYRRHDGRNTDALAREYGMTTTSSMSCSPVSANAVFDPSKEGFSTNGSSQGPNLCDLECVRALERQPPAISFQCERSCRKYRAPKDQPDAPKARASGFVLCWRHQAQPSTLF